MFVYTINISNYVDVIFLGGHAFFKHGIFRDVQPSQIGNAFIKIVGTKPIVIINLIPFT